MNRPVFQFRVIFAVCDEDIVERMNRNRVKTAGKMRVWIIGHDEIHLAGFQQIDALGRSLVCHLDVDIRKGAVETVQVRNKEIAADCVARADAELAANVYPGLFDIASEQCLPYINMMTMNTSEIVLVQVTNSSDVDKVKSILQSRIDAQVEGGAWYPSAIDAWQNNSRIVSNGNYIMMVVHESCDSIVSDFNALF